ncbi:hypothetical protein AA0481_2380 [Acetobacter orientalis NRIC 0481]|nr:hypothetical protein AA0481_2380 [Acetobacter orientalis NRIC 0481]
MAWRWRRWAVKPSAARATMTASVIHMATGAGACISVPAIVGAAGFSIGGKWGGGYDKSQ